MPAWKIIGNEIFVAYDDEEQNFVPYSCRFETTEKIVDVLTNQEEIVVKIFNGYTDPEIKIDRKIITETMIVKELTRYGVSIPDQEDDQLLAKSILTETEKNANQILQFSKLGFEKIQGEEVYLADRLYTSHPSYLENATCAFSEMKSQGTLKQYRRFLIKEVSQRPKLALALALGVTAPVAHILKMHGVFYETLLWSFCGESSTGKTTSLLAMLSLFGNPQYLISNLNATSNALATQVSAQSGFPFVADEATRSKIDFDELIYSLSSGKGKRRCNGDGSLKKLVNFSGAAFFSSEHSILDQCSEQGGEEARVIEFELNWFDQDRKKADEFLRFFNTHYGVAAEPLARLILDNKIQRKIVSHFEKALDRLAQKVVIKDGIDARIVQRLAIIAVSCWLLQKAIRVDFHIEDIIDLLVDVFDEKQTRICRADGTERLIQLFAEDYIHNSDKYFVNPDAKKSARHASFSPPSNMRSMRGMLSNFQGRKCLWLPADTFNEILARQTTYGTSTAKKKLHEQGYLKKFGSAYYKWCNFGAISTNAYCVFLPEQNDPAKEIIEADESCSLQVVPAPTLIAGFVSLTAQQIDMVINAELAAQLKLQNKGRLFLHTWGGKEFLLLSVKPSDKAISLVFEKVGNAFVASDVTIATWLQAINLKVARKERLLLTDITIFDKAPSAAIYIDNPHGQRIEKIDNHDPYRILQPVGRKTSINNSQIHSLLEDDINKKIKII